MVVPPFILIYVVHVCMRVRVPAGAGGHVHILACVGVPHLKFIQNGQNNLIQQALL